MYAFKKLQKEDVIKNVPGELDNQQEKYLQTKVVTTRQVNTEWRRHIFKEKYKKEKPC